MLFGYSILGDADLNRTVNTMDFNRLAGNFGASLKVFGDGDFDYGGVVDSSDFNPYLGQYGRKMTSPGPAPASALFSAGSSSAGAKELIDLIV